MVALRPEPLIVVDEPSKALMFALMSEPHAAFEFAAMLQAWFGGDTRHLAAFMEWLDDHDLEIRKKT